MCGLTGVALGPRRRRRSEIEAILDAFTELLVRNEDRGPDASGIAVVDRDGAFALMKRPLPPSTLVRLPIYDWTLALVSNRTTAILGHTRRPTRGSVLNPMNNQPIRRGATIATHNGTILNADSLADWFGHARLCEVDSEVLATVAEDSPSLAELVRRLRRVEGYIAAALVRVDDPTRVQLLRGNRPLAIHHSERWRATFWSSRAEDLEDVFGASRDLAPMTGVTVRDGQPIRRFRLALGGAARREDDAVRLN